MALIVLNQHSPAQLGKCPIYSSILSTLSSTTILQFFPGLKKSEPKDQNFLLPPVMGLYDFTLHKAFLLYPRKFLEVPSGLSEDIQTLLPDPHLSAIKTKLTKVSIYIPIRLTKCICMINSFVPCNNPVAQMLLSLSSSLYCG